MENMNCTNIKFTYRVQDQISALSALCESNDEDDDDDGERRKKGNHEN